MQLVMGYMVGRIMVAVVFIPAYFRGELLTVYQLLVQRFGTAVKRFASGLFLVTRTLADGFRLFATGLVLAALLITAPDVVAWIDSLFPALDPTMSLLVFSVLVMGVATIVYTYLGGIAAVILTDLLQLVIYLLGAFIAAWILVDRIPGGISEATRVAGDAGRLSWFDFTFDVTRGYTFWSGVIGGAFLTTATHGTDQMMVQRYLCSKNTHEARKALLWSGVAVFLQFMLFLAIGALLYVFYTHYASGEIASFTLNGRLQTDRIFPHFIVTHLPPGVVGIVCAAIFAAAMSTLSSSLNSSAAAAMADFYMPLTHGQRSDAHYLHMSRLLTALWGVLQVVVALAAINLSTRVVDEVLGIASFTNGLILGLFLLGTFAPGVRQRAAFMGVAAGAAVMLFVKIATPVNWQWYVLIGSVVTFAIGWTAARVGLDESAPA
jgi:SSS family transporter